MITNDDIFSEIEAMETVRAGLKSDYEKSMLKGEILMIRLLHNIRTNMVAVMKHQGIELVKAKQQKTQDNI